MANTKVKQTKYEHEKEHNTDITICKVCGKRPEGGIYGLVGGICVACHNKANVRKSNESKYIDGSGLLGIPSKTETTK